VEASDITLNENPLRKRREDLGLTRAQLVRRLAREGVEVSAQAIYHWETYAAKVPGDKLPAIERALELPEGTLYHKIYVKAH